MLADVRYALRTFARRPSFALSAVVILAIGISVNTIAFSLVNSLALRPLPVPDADRVVRLYPVEAGGRTGNLFPFGDVTEYRSQASEFVETLAGYMPADVTAGPSSVDRAVVKPRGVLAYVASSSYFAVTGVRPALGRVLQPADDARDVRVVVLSHAFWQRRFGGDEAVLGATLAINAQPFTIVGVAVPGFAGTEPMVADVWMPVSAIALARPGYGDFLDPGPGQFLAIGRLRRGVSRARAAGALDVVAQRLLAAHPGNWRPRGVQMRAGTFFVLDPELKPILAVAFSVVGLVLLIACGNVANLMLARGVARQREIAVRLAIGASRSRIVRQLVAEALLLSVAAGGAALLVSTWALRVMYTLGVGLVPLPWTVALTLAPDVRVFAYTSVVAIGAGLVFGLAPALQAASPDLVRALHDVRSVGRVRVTGAWLRHALVVLQVTGSLVLLAAAGLLLRGLKSAEALDLGFTTRGVVFADYDLNAKGYSAPRAAAFNTALADRVSAASPRARIAFTSHVPLHGGVNRIGVRLADAAGTDPITTTTTVVSPEYFEVLELPFVAGRNFAPGDATAVVISEGLARRFWPGQAALGKALTSTSWDVPRTVVGVVRDAANAAIWRDKEMSVYVPLDGTRDPRVVTAAIVRADDDPVTVRSVMESTAASLDPDLRFTATPLADLLRLWLLPSRIAAAAAGTLAMLALFLASFGLYAVLSFTVTQRLPEIGIRIALGATSRDVATLVLADASRLVGAGLIFGGVLAALAAPLLGRLLFGVSGVDPLTMTGVAVVLVLVALTASYLPARRAVRLAPIAVLRVD